LIKVGRDESAENILKELQKEKIIPLATKEKAKTTAFSVIFLAPAGERTILVYRGASDDLKIKEIPFEKIDCRWAHISPGNTPYPVIKRLFNHFSKNKILIAFNPSRYFLDMGIKKLTPLLNKTKVAILNREEAASLTGVDYQKEKEIFKKLDKVIDGIAVMTESDKGVLVSDGKNIYKAGIFKGRLVDRTGAGDAFGSGFVAGLIHEIGNWKLEIGNLPPKAVEYAIRLGSANATSVIESIGAKEGILTRQEFEKSPRWKNLLIKVKNLR
ncbi:carbohydrate kinase family protein, partial [Candidatus Wolfebacteria bacterium]|nr:carbohydrate kinase family protein [Candidatus Wolfebacteria bacterium]